MVKANVDQDLTSFNNLMGFTVKCCHIFSIIQCQPFTVDLHYLKSIGSLVDQVQTFSLNVKLSMMHARLHLIQLGLMILSNQHSGVIDTLGCSTKSIIRGHAG